MEKQIYTVEWIDSNNGTICLKHKKEEIITSIQNVEFIGFNKLYATLK